MKHPFGNKFGVSGFLLFLLAAEIFGTLYFSPSHPTIAPSELAVNPVIYICPMHPSIQQGSPGICPICGMPLVGMTKGASEFVPAVFPSTINANVQFLSQPASGEAISAVLNLSKPDGSPVTFHDLKLTHTKRIHLLIVDDSLSDYAHVHPVETSKPGEYAFTFQPKHGGHYNFVADLLPAATGRQEYAKAGATIMGTPAAPYRWINSASRVNGYWFYLVTNQNQLFVAGEPISLKVIVTDSHGSGITCLEPLMAAFAHGVAFSSDLSTVLHVHPIGPVPAETSRGGPFLEFKMVPRTPGYMKFYVQVQINHENVYASFGINVHPSGEAPVYHPDPPCD